MYTLHELEEPSANSIRELDQMLGERMEGILYWPPRALLLRMPHHAAHACATHARRRCGSVTSNTVSIMAKRLSCLTLVASCAVKVDAQVCNVLRSAKDIADAHIAPAHDPSTSTPAAGEAFKERVGSAPEASPEHLRYGLWTAGQLLSAGSTARAFKRVLIFTADPNPPGTGPKAHDSR